MGADNTFGENNFNPEMEYKQQYTMLNIMKKALEWWDNFTTEEKNDIEREHGYYGHDIGTTEEDVLYFYTQKDR
jgi:hypothetical protein